MCIESWGQSSFARCLIEVNAYNVLKESIPLFDGSRFSKETIHVEYGWKPPRCDLCKIFGHIHDQCPKNSTVIPIVEMMSNDGFYTVVNNRKKGTTGSVDTNCSAVNVGKATWQPIKSNVRFQPNAHGDSSKNGALNVSTFAKDGRTKQLNKVVDISSSSATKKGY
ncbi:hypothetical protein Tco_0896527, partial [Tanacetum coccineum]